jgi:hypothetical protein
MQARANAMLTLSKEMQFPGWEPLGMRDTSCTGLPCDNTSHCKQSKRAGDVSVVAR